MKIFKKVLMALLLITSILAVSLVIFINVGCEKIVVNGSSMTPTLCEGQLGIYVKSNSLMGNLKRGDIVIFERQKSETEKDKYIKRIIGKPKEHISIKYDGSIYINDQKISQKFIEESQYSYTYQSLNFKNMDLVLGEDEYFVLGDNRQVSYDSRYFGPIKKESIKGKLILTYGKWKNYSSNENKGDKKIYFPIKFY